MGLLPAVEFVEQPAPMSSPLAFWDQKPESITLGFSGLGSVKVDAERISVLAPDRVAMDATWTRLGQWANAQWLCAQGFRVLHGTAVCFQDTAIVLGGQPRCGASVLAFVLTRRGWTLLSDGLVVIDADGQIRAMEPAVTIDTLAGMGLPDHIHTEPIPAGRDRMKIAVAGHNDAAVGGYVLMRVQQNLQQLVFNSADPRSVASMLATNAGISPLFGGSCELSPMPVAPAWRLTRPTQPDPADPMAWSPPSLATMVADELAKALI